MEKNKNRPTKEKFYMKFAELTKERSTCKRLKVGAVLMDDDMTQFTIGYNGNYKGGPNFCDSDEPGNCGCIHAEVNALIKPRNFKANIMFLTDSPCVNCAKLIINAGIQKVYFKNEYRIKSGKELLLGKGILVIKL